MKEVVDRILEQVEADISEIDLYGYNIIETSLSMVHRLQTVLNDLRTKIQTYVFLTKEDEILFFKTQESCPNSLLTTSNGLTLTPAAPTCKYTTTTSNKW